MGRAWLDTVARRDDLRVSAIVDVSVETARGAAAERGWDIPCVSSVDEAFVAAGRPGMLLNVTIPEAHRTVSEAALRHGVPVLSEKPVTPTVSDALALAAVSELTGVLLATSQSRRYSAGIRSFREEVAGAGGAAQLTAMFFQNPRFGGFRDEMESPLLIDMAIHTFDQARYVLGADPVSVYCDEFSPPWSWYRGDAAAEAVFRFEDGARFAYSGSWCADGLTTSWNGSWRASTASGSVSWDGEAEVRAQYRDGDPRTVPVGGGEEGLAAALAEFVAALDGGPAPSGEVRANIWSLAMVEAALASARTGQAVRLDDVFAAASAHATRAARAIGDHAVAEAIAAWDGAPPR
ncbi:Gfo/Idh/MocA family oxidoreductase [Microbacterium ureisolvens]|uniref:Gfo/Idh/MocA family oxidoreductase n=2 Tax=Microbacterium ureisolvens TaxID=2781186 RepID=A0ABS7I2Z8_9MICO|nr:Gfo/Idh/MocA family oxidoreductase [Microbacterium ureisolvens]